MNILLRRQCTQRRIFIIIIHCFAVYVSKSRKVSSLENSKLCTFFVNRESRFETLETQKVKNMKSNIIDSSFQTRYSTYETESALQVSRISKPYKVSDSSFDNLKISFEPTPSLKARRCRKKLTIKYSFQLQPPICMNCLYSFSLCHA